MKEERGAPVAIGRRIIVTALGASDVPRTMRVGEVYNVVAEGGSVGSDHAYLVLEGHPSQALASITGDRWMVDPRDERPCCDRHPEVCLPCYWCREAERQGAGR